MGYISRLCPSRVKVGQDQSPGGSGPAEAPVVFVASKVGGRRRMGGHSQAAQAPTPPIPETEIEDKVQLCLNDGIDLVMHRHYRRQLVDARRKKKRKEKKEKEKLKRNT